MQALVYPHDVASSVDGSVVYVAEISAITPWRSERFFGGEDKEIVVLHELLWQAKVHV